MLDMRRHVLRPHVRPADLADDGEGQEHERDEGDERLERDRERERDQVVLAEAVEEAAGHGQP